MFKPDAFRHCRIQAGKTVGQMNPQIGPRFTTLIRIDRPETACDTREIREGPYLALQGIDFGNDQALA